MWENLGLMLATILPVAVAVEAFTEIVIASKLTKMLWRDKLNILAERGGGWVYLREWQNCGYCFSVTVAFVFAIFLPGQLFGFMPWDNILVKTLLLHRVSNLYHVWYELFRRGRVVPQEISLLISRNNRQEENNG